MDLSYYKGRRVFVTGHTGFKGTWLSRILLLAGADVTGFSLAPVPGGLFGMTDTAEGMRSITGDIRDAQALRQAVREAAPEVVLHLAAQPLVRESYRNPAGTYETNVMGTVNVLEAVRACPPVKSVVNVTTDKVYLNREWVWGYRENEELCGRDPYSNSKSCSELVTHSYRLSFFDSPDAPAVSTARSGNVIGGGDRAEDRIIPDCVRAAAAGKTVVLRNPQSVRPYQHVLECLAGYLLLAQKQCSDRAAAGAYNFGPDGEGCVTTGDLAGMFCRAWGSGAAWKSVHEKSAPHEANFLRLDCSKAKECLGWTPRWDIGKAVEKTVEWEKSVAAGKSAAETTDRQIREYFGW